MGETDYNALLYDKMKAEQDKYRDWLLNQPPEEILNHTYEYTMREDIVMCMHLTQRTRYILHSAGFSGVRASLMVELGKAPGFMISDIHSQSSHFAR